MGSEARAAQQRETHARLAFGAGQRRRGAVSCCCRGARQRTLPLWLRRPTWTRPPRPCRCRCRPRAPSPSRARQMRRVGRGFDTKTQASKTRWGSTPENIPGCSHCHRSSGRAARLANPAGHVGARNPRQWSARMGGYGGTGSRTWRRYRGSDTDEPPNTTRWGSGCRYLPPGCSPRLRCSVQPLDPQSTLAHIAHKGWLRLGEGAARSCSSGRDCEQHLRTRAEGV